MELRQLKYALQIAIEKNFSRAAEKLHITQPSLSQQLSKLENEMGVKLFQRNTNSVQLTHAGSLFIEKAQHILDACEQLQQEMDDISLMRKGKLTVGSLPITGAHILPMVLPIFKARYPEIEINLIEETTTRLEQLTASGQADISLLSLPLIEQSLTYDPLIEEEIYLAVPPDHKLSQANELRTNVAIKDLKHEPFIILKKGQGFRTITLDLCKAAGFVPTVVFESTNIETVQSLVAAGMGVAFVPQMVARAKWSKYAPVYLPLADPRPSRTLVIAYRKDRYMSKAALAFKQTISEILEQQF